MDEATELPQESIDSAKKPEKGSGLGGEALSEETLQEVESAENTEVGETAEDEFSLPRVLEAILFASQKPVSLKELQTFCKGAAASNPEDPRVQAFAKLKESRVREAFDKLQATYEVESRTFELRETATGWQLVTKPLFAPWLRQLFPENRPARLSAPAVETLAIIAYRQPITRGDIEAVRGVAVDGVMQSLMDRELIKIAGRADVPGRPLLYETTTHFMEHFGLRTLEELPNGTELRRVALPVADVPEPEKSSEEDSKTESDVAETPTDETEAVESSETQASTPATSEETVESSESVVEEPPEVVEDEADGQDENAAGNLEEDVLDDHDR